jgi:hypothetical protein
VKIHDPKDYFEKFDLTIQQQANELIDLLLKKFPELTLGVKYNVPFFGLKSNGWSVFELIYQKQGFKIGFVNDAAQVFYDTGRSEQLRGGKDFQAIFFDPKNNEDIARVLALIKEAIDIQSVRQ